MRKGKRKLRRLAKGRKVKIGLTVAASCAALILIVGMGIRNNWGSGTISHQTTMSPVNVVENHEDFVDEALPLSVTTNKYMDNVMEEYTLALSEYASDMVEAGSIEEADERLDTQMVILGRINQLQVRINDVVSE